MKAKIIASDRDGFGHTLNVRYRNDSSWINGEPSVVVDIPIELIDDKDIKESHPDEVVYPEEFFLNEVELDCEFSSIPTWEQWIDNNAEFTEEEKKSIKAIDPNLNPAGTHGMEE